MILEDRLQLLDGLAFDPDEKEWKEGHGIGSHACEPWYLCDRDRSWNHSWKFRLCLCRTAARFDQLVARDCFTECAASLYAARIAGDGVHSLQEVSEQAHMTREATHPIRQREGVLRHDDDSDREDTGDDHI
jgi:hypothetical protein